MQIEALSSQKSGLPRRVAVVCGFCLVLMAIVITLSGSSSSNPAPASVYTPEQQKQLGAASTTTRLGFVGWLKGLLGGKKKGASGGKEGCQRCYSKNKKCCGVKSNYQCYTTSSSECKHLQ